MSRFKTISAWLMIAVWLSSCFFAPASRSHSPHAQGHPIKLFTRSALVQPQDTAILPNHCVRASGVRLGQPLTDGPSVLFLRPRFELTLLTHLQPDATGLAPVALAQSWQFQLRAAPHPRSPSFA